MPIFRSDPGAVFIHKEFLVVVHNVFLRFLLHKIHVHIIFFRFTTHKAVGCPFVSVYLGLPNLLLPVGFIPLLAAQTCCGRVVFECHAVDIRLVALPDN